MKARNKKKRRVPYNLRRFGDNNGLSKLLTEIKKRQQQSVSS